MTMPTTTTPIDGRTFRTVLGHFPSGVTVITGTLDGVPVGFTCQSFSSLSLDPPLILMLPSRTSTSWPLIRRSGRFCVNVLAEDQADLSSTFARSGTYKFADVRWQPSPLGSPVLAGVSAWLDCTVAEVLPGGDHHIVVGEVKHCQADGAAPLLFHGGRYRVARDRP